MLQVVELPLQQVVELPVLEGRAQELLQVLVRIGGEAMQAVAGAVGWGPLDARPAVNLQRE